MAAEQDKLKKYFSDMLVYKSPDQGKFFSVLSLPSFMRDWILMKFADENGVIDKEEVSAYVRKVIPKKEQWEHLKFEMARNYQSVRFLAKVKVEIDISSRTAFFSLPDFAVPKRKGEAIADWDTVELNKDYLFSPNEVWGVVELVCTNHGTREETVIKMVDFKPFCPYTIDMDYYIGARAEFTLAEWIDIILSAIDYNPAGYSGSSQKLTMLSRLLPFIEKRLNLIELAPKGTGKSYLFSQLSKYGWLISGGSISRAKMFYDISKGAGGLASRYDYVALDEVQSITFPDKNEMQGILKGYMESGEYRVGDYRGTGHAGVILLGNIDEQHMNVNVNMFMNLPEVFHESALIDRFHGFIKGWAIPRMKEDLKVNAWALNVEYFSEILHMFRDEPIYRVIVDEVLDVPTTADTRDTEAIKKICTGFMKLLFPHIRKSEDIDSQQFSQYCLEPAKSMRRIIKTQLGIIDTEYRGRDIPDIVLKSG
ncbi:BREX system Lon protease-like protein BrxL [Candidatus Magnetominusculus xianensis]|uniref:ATP-dependent protease n=1 Tax=Candidatus Magnetominusculus xianensis TaxID=1748249 RepID=A0ABR5SEU2_9BACT|nr:BREX system Lon protease-like protein BrxL [Candidatus Magnetominusculus xianensis]KWT75636.1 ATP-dependent protease [Candidatus Magnetominusculus xianensis]MBF0403719.1 BREX system Lon protease-like protein BrxL [Nitrospirota bacterium]